MGDAAYCLNKTYCGVASDLVWEIHGKTVTLDINFSSYTVVNILCGFASVL